MAKLVSFFHCMTYRTSTNNSTRAASVDDDLYKAHMDITPGKVRKGSVFGSLEKVFNMLTPKKQRNSSSDGPRKVKVSTYIFGAGVQQKVQVAVCAH